MRGQAGYIGDDGVPRLNVLDLQKLIRSIPKVVIALVAGYAVGGGHVLHLVCDLTLAADNAIFGQTGPKVGSFDGGFGSSYLARVVGQKKAREIWFLCRQYNAQQALEMGLPTLPVGIRAICREEAELIAKQQIPVIWDREIAGDPNWIEKAIAKISTEKVFLTIDVDGIDPALIPLKFSPNLTLIISLIIP